jgi:DNA-3-methyladenine glycosylase II
MPVAMPVAIPVRRPFSFEQARTFISRFPACQGDTIIEDDRVTAAFAIDGRARAFTLYADRDELTLDAHDAPDRVARELARRAAEFVGADDDVAAFYRAAEGDAAMAPVIRTLHGLHHVRFLAGLAEIAVYAVLMQRTPPPRAARGKQKFLDAFGLPVRVGGRELRAMPELAELAKLDASDIAAAVFT